MELLIRRLERPSTVKVSSYMLLYEYGQQEVRERVRWVRVQISLILVF